MAVVRRDELLKCLAAVEAGLSTRDIIEQSSCYIFKDGEVWTFNDDVLCCIPLPEAMKEFRCAVPAASLHSLLMKMEEENIDVSLGESAAETEGQLLLKTKQRRAGMRVQLDINLPLEEVAVPDHEEQWVKIPEGLVEAVETVEGCAGRSESAIVLTCLRFSSGGIEATDAYQAIRYRLTSSLSEPVMVKCSEIVKIIRLGIEEWAVADSWLFFRNSSGLVAGCRRWTGNFPDLSPYFDVSGRATGLPKPLVKAAEKAEVFVDAKRDIAGLVIDLSPSRLLLRGEGPMGWYEERMRSEYSGEPVRFHIAPRLLGEVCRRSDRCIIGKNKLKVTGERFVYVTCLAVKEENE